MAGKKQGAGSNFSIRLPDALRQQLERAAAKAGHSLNNEIRHRLTRSLDLDRNVADTFGDRRSYAFFRLLRLADPIDMRAGRRRHWLDDPYQYEQVAVALRILLLVLRPRKGARRPKGHPDPTMVGLTVANHVLRTVKDPDATRESMQSLMERPAFKTLLGDLDARAKILALNAEHSLSEILKDVLDRAPDDLLSAADVAKEIERSDS